MWRVKFLIIGLLSLMQVLPVRAADMAFTPDPAAAARFAQLALTCLHHEYPNHISHALTADEDAKPPHVLTPAFYGCFDWHSAVHGHWLLVRLLRLFPDAPYAQAARAALDQSLTPESIAAERLYLSRPGKSSWERPYGLAWLLRLSAELRQWDDPQAKTWSANLQPLEAEAALRLKQWIPKLQNPIRIGEHNQTAFSFGQMWDWAAISGDAEMTALLRNAAERFYRRDRNCPIQYEPSGEDFLSPCLAEADFMARTLDGPAYTEWLHQFLPDLDRPKSKPWLAPALVSDRSDPKLAHIDGLNLSRAWMQENIARRLSAKDKRIAILQQSASQHRAAALPEVTGEHYEGGHWLGTFAVYLISQPAYW
jgi:hypothetical protein